MDGSIRRVRDVVAGRTPDRPPIYEIFRNDAVISRFAGETLTVENAPETVFRAYEPALDATRPVVRMPDHERTETLPDGRERRFFRWTAWTEHRTFADTDAWAAEKRRRIDGYDPAWNEDRRRSVDAWLADTADHRRRLGDVFFFPSGRHVSLTSLYVECGWEMFAWCMADHPDVVDELLELATVDSVEWIRHLPDDHGVEAVFCADDIAFKTGPFCSPAWFDEHYMPRFARVVDAWHEAGARVLFHSDGNLLPLLDALVDAGIDGVNPLEILAGMDPGEVHRRYPHLFLCGGVDVSQLLPFGSPGEVADAVRAALDATEGRLMVGSSTELNNEVPLENYLALRDAVLEYEY